jgi:hypothetical protein
VTTLRRRVTDVASEAEYTQPFYGAFVLDPDGFKVEAVCRQDQGSDARVAQ